MRHFSNLPPSFHPISKASLWGEGDRKRRREVEGEGREEERVKEKEGGRGERRSGDSVLKCP